MKLILCFLIFTSLSVRAVDPKDCVARLSADHSGPTNKFVLSRLRVTEQEIFYGDVPVKNRSDPVRARQERLFLTRILQSPGEIVHYESLVRSIEPGFANLSSDEKFHLLHVTSINLRWALRQLLPGFDLIQEFEPRGYFWGAIDSHSKTLVTKGHLRVTEHQVYWKEFPVSPFTRGEHAPRERALLMALLDASKQSRLTVSKILRAAWPEYLDQPLANRVEMAHALMSSLYEDFLNVDPLFRDIKKTVTGYYWKSGEARTEDDLYFEPLTHDFFYWGEELALREESFKILRALLIAENGFRSREDLVRILSGDESVGLNVQTSGMLTKEIKILRDPFFKKNDDFHSIETIFGKGYAWFTKIL